MTSSPRKLSAERPGAAALAVAHALALLHARQDHAAELARRAELEATASDPRSHLRPLLVRTIDPSTIRSRPAASSAPAKALRSC